MKLIIEKLDLSSFEFLNESLSPGGEKSWKIRGPFMTAETKNRNGRVYPKQLVEREIEVYNKDFIVTHSSYGELDHPPTPQLNLDRVSHLTESLEMVGKDGIGCARLLDTPMGKIAQSILAGGGRLGVSTRGVGTLKGESVNDDYKLLAIDIVASPSAPDAYVNGILESKEWILSGNTIMEKAYDKIEEKLKNTGSKNIIEALHEFLQFIKRG